MIMETARCCVCGEEYLIRDMFETFTGRMHYTCPRCKELGNNEIDEKISAWRQSYIGRKILEQHNKAR